MSIEEERESGERSTRQAGRRDPGPNAGGICKPPALPRREGKRIDIGDALSRVRAA